MKSRILERYDRDGFRYPYGQFDKLAIDDEWIWLTRKASETAKQYWADAYRFDDDDDAIQFSENALKPLIRYSCGRTDDLDTAQIDNAFEEAIEEYSELENFNSAKYHIPTTSLITREHGFDADNHTSLDDVLHQLDHDIDTVVGVYSGGMNSMYLASSYFDDPDEILVRYSHLKRCDDHVHTTPAMDERLDNILGKDVLLVDDVLATGETLQEVSKYLHQFSPNSVTGFAHETRENVMKTTNLVDLNYTGPFRTMQKWFGDAPGIRQISTGGW